MKRIFFSLLFLSIVHLAICQDKLYITGDILDTSGKPIGYAHIRLSNSTIGTLSNASGKFSIVVPNKTDAYLIVSHVGYTSKSIPLHASKAKLRVILKEEIAMLNEVAVSTLTAAAVVERVIARLKENYHLDSINYILFTRITKKHEKPALLQEYMYNLFSINGKTNEYHIIKLRSMAFDQWGKKEERGTYVTSLQTNDSHIMLRYTDRFLRKKKMKRYKYSFLDDILYEGELYYRIKIESVKNNYTIGGEIWVHPGNYGVAYVKSVYSDENLGEFYFGRENESYYQLIDDKWYFSHGFYRFSRTNKKTETTIHYDNATVVTDFKFTRQFDRKDKLDYYTERVSKYYEPFTDDFWSDHNHIPLDSLFQTAIDDMESR